jgi:hypothetical protein
VSTEQGTGPLEGGAQARPAVRPWKRARVSEPPNAAAQSSAYLAVSMTCASHASSTGSDGTTGSSGYHAHNFSHRR